MSGVAIGVGLLYSRVLAGRGVPHAFTTRAGGISAGIFASLNFGNPGDLKPEERDPLSNIHANFAGVLNAIGCGDRELVQVHQVHGGAVHAVRAGQAAHPGPSDTRADALVTRDGARVLAVRIADCAPVLIASSDGRAVAAVHAGWRGVVAGVVRNALAALRAEDGGQCFVAAVGPCLSVMHFEIGPEVAAEFEREFGPTTPHLRPGPRGRPLLDLKGALREQLEHAGVEEVDVMPHCTYADAERFFSHRRDAGRTGRMAAVIGVKG